MNDSETIVVREHSGQQRVEEPVIAIVPDTESAAIFVRWNWWQITQSDYHRRGTPNEIDLGEIL